MHVCVSESVSGHVSDCVCVDVDGSLSVWMCVCAGLVCIYQSLHMHENLNPGVCGYMRIWIVCVRVSVYTSVLNPGVYGLVCWVVCVGAYARCMYTELPV